MVASFLLIFIVSALLGFGVYLTLPYPLTNFIENWIKSSVSSLLFILSVLNIVFGFTIKSLNRRLETKITNLIEKMLKKIFVPAQIPD